MQIDGHHSATYVAARAAGFDHSDAAIVAYAAQYVDDATNAGDIYFHNSEYMYSRIASAHRMIDYNNLVEAANHLVWLPFHFLPGNDGLAAGDEPAGGELAKLICRPDSPVARDMLRACYSDRDNRRGLHRLGVAMHVYADTFAHQGFVGAMSKANKVGQLHSPIPGADEKLRESAWLSAWEMVWGNTKAVWQLLGKSLLLMIKEQQWPLDFWNDLFRREPLGHAKAGTYPDQPYLVWQYLCYDGTTIKRDNPADYVHAVDMMTRAMRAWRSGDESMALERHEGLCEADRTLVDELFRSLDEPDGKSRHCSWLQAIGNGRFSFGPAELDYIHKGKGSWKYLALGTEQFHDSGVERYCYSPAFLESDWKLFHDAVQAHRFDVVYDVLPRYGICAA